MHSRTGWTLNPNHCTLNPQECLVLESLGKIALTLTQDLSKIVDEAGEALCTAVTW